MDDEQIVNARRTLGTLLEIRNSTAAEFDGHRFFEGGQLEHMIRDPRAAAFAMLVAARFVAQGTERAKGTTLRPETYYGLRLPEYVTTAEPDLAMSFRIVVAVMNEDVVAAEALVHVATQTKQRAGNVFSCLVAMLSEAPPP